MSRLTLAVPAHARPAWDALQAQILANGPTPCAGPDRNDWTGNATQQDRAADRCLDCPVMTACLTYADTADEREDVWGGLTATQRRNRPRRTT
ncbi:WhiB family transcriptional regulator [Brachybacterium alimentarium]|uniref:WhiB family transcriptional regulator n=1 Tax=Brachybacterium alimentarium TaxID=47845 RepID=UPI003FD5EDEE